MEAHPANGDAETARRVFESHQAAMEELEPEDLAAEERVVACHEARGDQGAASCSVRRTAAGEARPTTPPSVADSSGCSPCDTGRVRPTGPGQLPSCCGPGCERSGRGSDNQIGEQPCPSNN